MKIKYFYQWAVMIVLVTVLTNQKSYASTAANYNQPTTDTTNNTLLNEWQILHETDGYDWAGRFQVNLGVSTDIIDAGIYLYGQYNLHQQLNVGLMFNKGFASNWNEYTYFGVQGGFRLAEFYGYTMDEIDANITVGLGYYNNDWDLRPIVAYGGVTLNYYFSEHVGIGGYVGYGGPSFFNLHLTSRL